MEKIFLFSAGFLFFIYGGYGILLWVVNRLFKNGQLAETTDEELPHVAVVIAAYNEEPIIESKIKNTLALNYPSDKLHIYLVSDGSTDKTNEIASRFKEVTILWSSLRRGKTAAINRAMKLISEPVTVFTDSNVMLNSGALINMVVHYADPYVGGVSGEKQVVDSADANASSTEGLYWKYESFLKHEDAKLSTLVGAAGELFSVRTALYEPIPDDTLLDDFIISMNIIRKGYRIAYEPTAYARELPSVNLNEEFKRKVRISAGGLQSVFRLPDLLNIFRYGVFTFQYLIHRVSRWILSPLLIVLAFISNAFIAFDSLQYLVLFEFQICFHICALAGWYCESKGIKIKALFVPFYFNFMHVCIVAGWFRYFSGKQDVRWQKAERLLGTEQLKNI